MRSGYLVVLAFALLAPSGAGAANSAAATCMRASGDAAAQLSRPFRGRDRPLPGPARRGVRGGRACGRRRARRRRRPDRATRPGIVQRRGQRAARLHRRRRRRRPRARGLRGLRRGLARAVVRRAARLALRRVPRLPARGRAPARPAAQGDGPAGGTALLPARLSRRALRPRPARPAPRGAARTPRDAASRAAAERPSMRSGWARSTTSSTRVVTRARHFAQLVYPPNDLGPTAAPGPYPVGVRTLELVDPAAARRARHRPAARHDRGLLSVHRRRDRRRAARRGLGAGHFRSSRTPSYRDVAVADGRFPLVLFSHGNGGIRFQSFFFAAHLASHGYVVVIAGPSRQHLRRPAGGHRRPRRGQRTGRAT